METRGSQGKAISHTTDDVLPVGRSEMIRGNPDQLSRENLSYLRLFLILIASIFLAEVAAMALIYILTPLPYQYATLIDAGVMTALVFPALYFLSFRPLIRHIGERYWMELALRKQQELDERFFNSIDLLIAYMDCDFNFVHVNDAYARENGQSPGCFVGKNLFVLHPHPETEKLFRRVLETGEPCSAYEDPAGYFQRSCPELTYWDWSLQPVKGANGIVEGLVLSLLDVTQRKRAADTVRQLSRIVEQTEDTVVVTDHSGLIEYVNPSFERLTGFTKEDALGKTPRVLKSGIHNHFFYQNLWETVLRGEVFQGQIANRKKNGELLYEVKTITPLRDTDGRITHFVATGKDITRHKQDEEKLQKAYDELEARVQERTEELRIANSELEDEIQVRHRAEKALRKSEQGLNRAQEIAHLGSWELDLVNNQLSWSDEVYRIFGLQPQEFGASYEAFLEVVHPDDRVLVDEAYSGSIRDGRDMYEIEHRIIQQSSGEVRFVHEKCEHFRDEEGEIIRSAGMVHDITERKQVEEALREAHDDLELRVRERTAELAVANQDLVREIAERREIERQLRLQTTAMEAAANGIIITDDQGTIQWANPAIIRISGYHHSELVGQNTSIFNSGWHDTAYYRHLWETILLGRVWQGETTNRRKDGTLYVEEQTITPVRADHGQITHFIAIKQDITERKQAEERLEQRNAELQIISTAERHQRQFSEALIQAALILNRSLKLSEVLSLILEQIRGTIPYQFADILFLEGDSFYDASHRGEPGWPSTQMEINSRFRLEDFPLLNRIGKSGMPLLVRDSREEPDWTNIEGFAWVRSLLSAPLLVESKVIGLVNLFSDQPGFFTQQMSDRLVVFAAHAAVAIQNAWLFEQVQASTERLQSLSRRLVEIQENERLHISRELHDEAGQVLTSLLVDLRLLEKNSSQPDAILKIVAEMERSLNGVIENLHRMAMSLRPASLDHVGLVAALRQHVEAIGEKHGIQASFRSSGVIERLPANVETILYRTVQEALTNVVRHAHATRVDVVMTVREDKLVVLVEDDGVGFDPETVSTEDHLGLFGIRERSEMIGATLVVESAPGKGTTIMLEVGYADSITGRR
jgi:PAS domain S-box-containing protein